MKVITVCGSYRFEAEMKQIAECMALQGNCMLTPVDLTRPDKSSYTAAELALLGEEHKQKIKLSDAILVVNVGGYIGSATRVEIAYAEALGKEILYYTDLIE